MRAILRPLWENRYLRLAAFLLVLAAVLWFFYQTRVPWTIFLLSYTVAYLVNPLVSWLQRRRIPRWLGVFAAFLLLSGLIALTTFVVSEFVQQVTAFFERSPDLAGQIARWYEGLPALARRSVPAPLLDLLSQYGNDLEGALEQALVASSERLARVGQDQAPRRPPEETGAQPLLEPREASTHGGARDPQLGGGARERTRVDGLREGEELGRLDGFGHLDQKVADAARC